MPPLSKGRHKSAEGRFWRGYEMAGNIITLFKISPSLTF